MLRAQARRPNKMCSSTSQKCQKVMRASAIVSVELKLQSPPRRMMHFDRLHNGTQIAPTLFTSPGYYFFVVCLLPFYAGISSTFSSTSFLALWHFHGRRAAQPPPALATALFRCVGRHVSTCFERVRRLARTSWIGSMGPYGKSVAQGRSLTSAAD